MQDVLSEVALLAGRQDEQVLVVVEEVGTAGLTEGASVTFIGQVETLPSSDDVRDRWRLPETSLPGLSPDDVYVAAERIQAVDADGSE